MTIFLTNKTFDDSLLHINNLQKSLTDVHTQIESIQSWLDETQNYLSKTESNNILLSTKFNQFYTKPYAPELPTNDKDIKTLDANYKEFMNTLNIIQTDLDKIQQELSQKQEIFNSIKNSLSNISIGLKTECHNKENISNRIGECRFLENQFHNIKNKVNSSSIPISLSNISNTLKRIYEKSTVSQKIQETWSKEITKIQSDLGILPVALNISFDRANYLVKDVKSEKMDIQNELSKVLDELSKQESQFIEFKKRYNQEINKLDNTCSTNYSSNLKEQLIVAQTKRSILTKLANDNQLIVDTTKDLQIQINHIYRNRIQYKTNQLEYIIKDIKTLNVSPLYSSAIQSKLLILNEIINDSKVLMNRAQGIEKQINNFIANLNDANAKTNDYINAHLSNLNHDIKGIKYKLRIRILIIFILLIIVGIVVFIIIRYFKEKKDLDKLSIIEKDLISMDKFSKYIEIIESPSRLYITRQEALKKAENIISNELQECIVNIHIIPNQTVENDIENIRIKINILKDSVRKLERTKSREEGDIKIRNELLSKINALELQLSELRDVSD